ncbi:MAG: hypothetical protein M5R40_07500 [Anaerolineae bacterium]|jgi:hypothetical protein|nr:hypothetical protein [Anaerolineae bacterium]
MSRYVPQKRERRTSRWLPVVGLTLAALLGVMSYLVAFPLVELGRDQSQTIDDAYSDLREQFAGYDWYADNARYHGNNIVEILVAMVLWLVLMGLAMLAVGVATYGTDPERRAWKQMGPPPANRKAVVKRLKKDLKEVKRQEREFKRKQH